jgi:4-amino-4-deoxy-L-arabinose transferase-like glycosyltransferase
VTTPAPIRRDPRKVVLDTSEKEFLRRLILYGFFLRVALALLLHWTGYSRILAPDEQTYQEDGWVIALYWMGEILTRPWRYTTGQPVGYFQLNAAFFYVFGHTEIPIKIANSLVGAFSCIYCYRLARELYGVPIARRTATLFEFLPSLVLWSALNIRDVWVVFLLIFLAWKSVDVYIGRSRTAILQFLLGVLLLSQFRDYLFYIVMIPPLVAFVIGRRGHLARNFLFAAITACAAVFLLQEGVVGEASQSRMSLEAVSQARQQMATGGSAFSENVDISTPEAALLFLPTGLAYFLFSPFPWQITSALKAISLPEMLLLYYLTPYVFRGIVWTVRERFRESLQVLLLTALITVSYALGSGNVGTMYRHRAQVIVFYLMFGAVGLQTRQVQSVPRQRAISPAR